MCLLFVIVCVDVCRGGELLLAVCVLLSFYCQTQGEKEKSFEKSLIDLIDWIDLID